MVETDSVLTNIINTCRVASIKKPGGTLFLGAKEKKALQLYTEGPVELREFCYGFPVVWVQEGSFCKVMI